MSDGEKARILRQEWARLFERYQWDHVAHLTFGFGKCSIELAMNRFENWINGLGSLTQGPTAWVVVPEETYRGLYHLHALLGGTRRLDDRQMKTRWKRRNGRFLRIDPYRDGGTAERYLTKRISQRFSEARMSRHFIVRASADQGHLDAPRSPATSTHITSVHFNEEAG